MKRQHLHTFVLAICLAGYGWIAWNLVAGTGADAAPTLCLFRNLTGLPCPSCGATRSLLLLVGGDPAGSVAENPVGALLALALLACPLWILVDTVRRADSFHRFTGSVDRAFSLSRAPAVIGAALIVANWYWNILKGL